MDIYAPDVCFRIDDLLDFSNDDLFSSSSTPALSPPRQNPIAIHHASPSFNFNPPDFTHHLSIPTDDVAHLEWLSQFVEDSFVDYPTNSITGTVNVRSETSLSSKDAAVTNSSITASAWKSSSETSAPSVLGRSKIKKDRNGRESAHTSEEGTRRCSHCASVKTPQWRTGPLGPKTLCNACGVRYKSGRLVPEYRPAASPTFVLTQHSNSHRKVLELRRQKEMLRQQMEEEER